MTKYNFEKMEVDLPSLERAIEGNAIALVTTFDWYETPQDSGYWMSQFNGDTPLDTNELENIRQEYLGWCKKSVVVGEPTPKSYDPVNKPAHYNTGGVECIDYIRQVLGLDGFIAYCHGNMIKYQHRYRYKQNPVEDMQKAEWYLKRMNEALVEKHK